MTKDKSQMKLEGELQEKQRTKESHSHQGEKETSTKHESSASRVIAPPSDIKQASDQIKSKLADALDKKSNATISISKDGELWNADVEIVEEEYLPGQNLKSMNDLIGLYDVSMDLSGNLLNWTKKKMYKRSQGL
jgi:hypothetical protein